MQTQVFSYNDSQPGAIAALGHSVISAVERGRQVVLDLDHMPALDNPALRGLITLLRRVRAAGGELMLRVTRPELRSTLRLTALDRVFEVAPC